MSTWRHRGRRLTAGALVIAAAALVAGCIAGATTTTTVVGDAQTAARVKTALVNDTTLGTLPIDVQVRGGLVTLRGTVRSAAEIDRALALARAVPGVVSVRSALEIDESGSAKRAPSVPTLPALAPRPGGPPSRFVAAGASLSLANPARGALANATAVGPILRFRPRRGFGPTLGFSWIEARFRSGSEAPPLALLRLRPVMAGVEYRVGQGRLTAAASIVAGYAFNRLVVDTKRAGAGRAIAVGNSFAWRPGGSVWYDISPRIGMNLFAGYLFTRPELTFASDSSVVTRLVTANAAIVSVGAAYWIF